MVRSWQEVVIVSDELPEEVQRWTAKRRSALIVSIIRGETSVQEAARKYGLTVAEVEDWREKFLLAAVIDCHDREIVGYEFSLRGRAKEAERALEEACIARFGTLRPEGDTPVLRSDNGLIFQSRRFRAALRDYRLRQEFITPYTPEQNGMIERFLRSLKEECVWQHVFADFAEARRTIPGLDPLVQRGAAPSEPQLPESGRVPGPTTTTGGLKSGEHYTRGKLYRCLSILS